MENIINQLIPFIKLYLICGIIIVTIFFIMFLKAQREMAKRSKKFYERFNSQCIKFNGNEEIFSNREIQKGMNKEFNKRDI